MNLCFGKLDLVMWTKDGESFLPTVLNRIEEVVPIEFVHRKIFIDDSSKDRSVEIARLFNWDVRPNPKGGIPSGANKALSHVTTDFFISVEQDVLLAKDWWDKITPYMENELVACAQGIRTSTDPILKKWDEYVYSGMKSATSSIFAVSIDNNIFRTRVVRQLGGFPRICPVCTDTVLIKRTIENGFKWIIDKSVVSEHLRPNRGKFYEHEYNLWKQCTHTKYCGGASISLPSAIRIFLASPIRASVMAYKTRSPLMLWVCPKTRYYRMKAYIDRRRELGGNRRQVSARAMCVRDDLYAEMKILKFMEKTTHILQYQAREVHALTQI